MNSGEASLLYSNIIITDITSENELVKTFRFKAEDDAFSYRAGQFITIVSTLTGERRSYSLASSPEADPETFFTVKRVDNGVFSRLLFDKLRPGDTLQIIKPAGFFTLPPDIASYKQIFFFVAGIGITPIFSLIKTVLFQYPDIRVNLVYSNRSVADTVFYKELEVLASRFGTRFKIHYLFSSAKDLLNARLSK